MRAVGEAATRRQRSEEAATVGLDRAPSARKLARLMTSTPGPLTRADALLIATIEAALPSLVKTRELVERFQRMLRSGKDQELDRWIDEAIATPLVSFAAGIRADRKAVAAAITEAWSNGQTEGQITRLKLVKRQMYGRAKLDLLAARLLATN